MLALNGLERMEAKETVVQFLSAKPIVGPIFLELAILIEDKYRLGRFEVPMLCGRVRKTKLGTICPVFAKIEKKYMAVIKKQATINKKL